MAPTDDESKSAAAWRRALSQHDVITGAQLRSLRFSRDAIRHRVERGRLHPLWRDVFAVGRPGVSDRGLWMAAVLACGEDAALSHESAAALLGIHRGGLAPIHVSVPGHRRRHRGIAVHERDPLPPATTVDGIRVTDPLHTLVDLAAHLDPEHLTRAVNEADRLNLVDHDELASLVDSLKGRRGIRKLRSLLGGYTRTDSDLERRFLRLVAQAGLPRPKTQVEIHGRRVDFYWPELKLVVETDGLTYHRTPTQQAADRKRDQVLATAGLMCIRFPNAQVRDEPGDVISVLERLREQHE